MEQTSMTYQAPPELLALLREHEGIRLAAYDDKTGEPVPVGGTCIGTLTIGYGHTGHDVSPGQTCTIAQAEAWLLDDVTEAAKDGRPVIGHIWDTLSPARQGAIIDMAYNMGWSKLAKFVNMIDAIRNSDWPRAHEECLKSKWAGEVSLLRSMHDADQLLTGEWPS